MVKSTRVVITVFDGQTLSPGAQAFGGLVMKTMPISSPVEFDLSLRHIKSIFADPRFTVFCDQAEEHAVVKGLDRITFDVWYLAEAFGGQPGICSPPCQCPEPDMVRCWKPCWRAISPRINSSFSKATIERIQLSAVLDNCLLHLRFNPSRIRGKYQRR